MRARTAPSTRERLLAGALTCLDAGGYAGATVSAIAGRAGVATGTLYRHFSSKEALFVEVFRLACDREYAVMRAAASDSSGALERLLAVFETFAERALQRRRRAWAFIAEPVDPLVDVERLTYRARYAALVEEVVGEGISTGELPAQETRFTAAALVGGCAEALVGPLSPVGDPSVDAAAVLAAQREFVRRAVGAP